MSMIGNVIWFILGGAILAVFWLFIAMLFYITIIGIPIGRACLEFAKLSAFPFGKEIVRETDVKGPENVAGWRQILHGVLNIIWILVAFPLTFVYFIYGIFSFITIIGIPVGIVYTRMGKFLLFPIGARVVEK
ncbi:MAG: YccF family protein [Bacteroidetes bacterium]|nr:YccF family protein [Bacteroidota bacterium]